MATDENLPKCDFEEINRARNDPNILVIDVREMIELHEVGHIPGAINIPLASVPIALSSQTPEGEFKRIYYSSGNFSRNTPIIFTCRSGRRSRIAQEKALALGYTNVKNYTGGWLDWEQQNKK